MPKIDKVSFDQALIDIGTEEGGRCKEALEHADRADVMVAAVTLSVVVRLRHLASVQPLKLAHLQLTANAFLAASGVAEKTDAMGAIYYERKPSLPP